jgi:conjugative transfer region protein TrbK
MHGKLLARIGAVVFVAFAITATVVELTHKDEPPLDRSAAATTSMTADPLKAELRRCQQLGDAGVRDAACLQTWADNRDRFLKPSQPLQPQPGPQAPGPQGAPTPHALDAEPTPAIDSHANEGR